MKEKLSYTKFNPKWGLAKPKDLPNKPAYTIVTESAKKWPQKVALVCCGNKVTYEELNFLSDRLARQLKEKFGVKKGDRIATMMPNCIQHTISIFAIWKLGCVGVPCNVMYTPQELAYQIEDAGVKTIIGLDVFYPTIAETQNRTKLENIILTSMKDFAENEEEISEPFISKESVSGTNTWSLNHLLSVSDGDIKYADVEIEDLALLLYTAGTTGKSKGVMEAHRNIWACTAPTVDVFGLSENDVDLQIMPMFHCSGYCLAQLPTLYAGGTVVLVPLFNPPTCIKWILEYKVNVIFAPPTFYVGLMNEPNFDKHDYSFFKYTVSCGAPQPDPVRIGWEKITGQKLLDGYGMTETMCQGASVLSMPYKYRPGAIGAPFNCEIKIVNEKGEILPRGEVGEIMFKGVGVAKGYWNKPKETAEAFLSDGWLHSGDAGYMDEDDFVYFVDRYKDLIVTSGYNVAPAEVEAILMAHPSVKEAAVIGVPDKYKGEAIKAVVSLKDDWKDKEEEKIKEALLNHCRKHLAKFKIPKYIEIREEIPKSAVGKILRRKLREE